jgi:hypothetical protein
MKSSDVKKTLSNELSRIEEEMYFSICNLGKDISVFKKHKIAESNNRLLL